MPNRILQPYDNGFGQLVKLFQAARSGRKTVTAREGALPLGYRTATPKPPPAPAPAGTQRRGTFISGLIDDSAGLETALAVAATFTLGPTSSGATVELANNLGPGDFRWSAEGVTSGQTQIDVWVPGFAGPLPWNTGAWSWDHSGTGDVMDTITVTKPAGAPLDPSSGDSLSRIQVHITQPV